MLCLRDTLIASPGIGQKIPLHCQLPNFGVQHLELLFPLGLFRLDFSGEDARRRLLELFNLSMGLRLVDPEFTAQLRNGLFTGKGGQHHLGFEGG